MTPRRLAGSEYATRVKESQLATEMIGPLREADVSDVESIADPVVRRRAPSHRLREPPRSGFRSRMRSRDHESMGRLMVESHRSMQFDYETSTSTMDAASNEHLPSAMCSEHDSPEADSAGVLWHCVVTADHIIRTDAVCALEFLVGDRTAVAQAFEFDQLLGQVSRLNRWRRQRNDADGSPPSGHGSGSGLDRASRCR